MGNQDKWKRNKGIGWEDWQRLLILETMRYTSADLTLHKELGMLETSFQHL